MGKIEGRKAEKAGGRTRQAGEQGRWADMARKPTTDVPTLTANIFSKPNIRTRTGGKYNLMRCL